MTTQKDQQWRERYGPWALVTGASSGIGREFATALAERGINVILIARRKARIEELSEQLTQKYSIESRCIGVDLSERDAVHKIERNTGNLDIGLIVANAGFGSLGASLNKKPEEELRMVDVNCRSVLDLCLSFGPKLRARGQGGVILMSSIVAFQGVALQTNYAATKAYVQSLADGLAKEWKPHGIDVLASAPGPVKTEFEKVAQMNMGKAEAPEVVARSTLNALGRKHTVRPGILAKLLGNSLSLLPRRGRSFVLGKVMEGML